MDMIRAFAFAELSFHAPLPHLPNDSFSFNIPDPRSSEKGRSHLHLLFTSLIWAREWREESVTMRELPGKVWLEETSIHQQVFLELCYVSGSALGFRDTSVNKTHVSSCRDS